VASFFALLGDLTNREKQPRKRLKIAQEFFNEGEKGMGKVHVAASMKQKSRKNRDRRFTDLDKKLHSLLGKKGWVVLRKKKGRKGDIRHP